MKVLIVNVFQNRGSTGGIIQSLGEYLESRGDEAFFCYRDGQKTDGIKNFCIGNRYETAINYRMNFVLGIPYGNAFLSTLRLIRIIEKIKPDVISFHSINGSYINIYYLLSWLKKRKYPVVFTHHSEYLYTGNCTYSHECNQWKEGCICCEHYKEYHLSLLRDKSQKAYIKMKKAWEGMEHCVCISVSSWVKNRAVQSRIMNRIPQYIIENGIDEKIFRYVENGKLKEQLGIGNQTKVILYSSANFSTRLDDIKGGYYVVELAKRLKNENIIIVIVAITVETSELPDNVIIAGSINRNELVDFYSMSDLLLLTSRKETFSMPTAEALMCGCPVVGFKAGGPESIAIHEYSDFVEYGNLDALENSIRCMLNNMIDKKIISSTALDKYSNKLMCDKYYKIFEKIIKDKKGRNESAQCKTCT